MNRYSRRQLRGRLFWMAVGAVLALLLLPLFPAGAKTIVKSGQDWVIEATAKMLPRLKSLTVIPENDKDVTEAIAPPRDEAPPSPAIRFAPEPRLTGRGRPSIAVKDLEARIHELVNEERSAALEYDHQLADIARAHSEDQATYGYFSHDNQSGQSPINRGNAAGYPCRKDFGTYYTEGIAENIFQTYLYSSYTYRGGVEVDKKYRSLEGLAQQIVGGWMRSTGHRRNILNLSYDLEGVGVSINDIDAVYVTQNFC